MLGFAACSGVGNEYLPSNQGGVPYQEVPNAFGSRSSFAGNGGASRKYSTSISGQYSGAGQYPAASSAAQAPILRLDNNNDGDGSYQYAYESANNINAQEQGVGGQQANGGFSYTSPEGETIQITYTADENGFHPQGSHLPTPPPIPEAILKSIELNRQLGQGRNQHNPPRPNYGAPQPQYGAPVAPKPVFKVPSAFKPSFGGTAQRTYVPPATGSNGGYQY